MSRRHPLLPSETVATPSTPLSFVMSYEVPSRAAVRFIPYQPPAGPARPKPLSAFICELCGRRDTPQMRRGEGNSLVCNRYPSPEPPRALTSQRRCGLRLRKEQRRRENVRRRMAIDALIHEQKASPTPTS